MDAKEYIERIAENGRRAARAQWRRDASGVRWENEQAERVYRMFRTPGEREMLRKVYADAYRAEYRMCAV
jgi:hypothetical protein